jgi:GDP-L-fucose synthase
MNILVTGATGFLGTALSNRLISAGHHVIRLGSKQADLTILKTLDQFNDLSFHQIYHLAAWTQAGDFCLHHAGEQWIYNQQINTNVLLWWKKYQPQAKLIAIGTSCAYDCDQSLEETSYLTGQPIESLYTYAMTKRMLYVGLLALQKQFGLNYLYLVPSTLYGPGYHTDGRQMHFIFDLIRKIMRAKLNCTSVILWGDGQQRRELIYIDDFVETTLHLAGSHDNSLINIGAGEDYSICEFARLICSLVDYDYSLIQFDRNRYVGARSKLLNINKLNRLVPHYKPIDLIDGLTNTIVWFQKNWDLIISNSCSNAA